MVFQYFQVNRSNVVFTVLRRNLTWMSVTRWLQSSSNISDFIAPPRGVIYCACKDQTSGRLTKKPERFLFTRPTQPSQTSILLSSSIGNRDPDRDINHSVPELITMLHQAAVPCNSLCELRRRQKQRRGPMGPSRLEHLTDRAAILAFRTSDYDLCVLSANSWWFSVSSFHAVEQRKHNRTTNEEKLENCFCEQRFRNDNTTNEGYLEQVNS